MSQLKSLVVAVVLCALVAAAAPLAAADGGVVNVNTASAAQLELLPGIGATVAQRIVEHREQNGAFKSIEDLMLVRGIGEKSFERIKPYLTTSGATTLAAAVPSPRPARRATQD
jgi:competence protein ComEA